MTVSRCEIFLIGLSCILFIIPLTKGLFFPAWYRRVTSFQENENCNGSSTKYAIVIHGWRESCKNEWVTDLKQNLEIFRGGCIICMDYESAAAIPHYLMLANHVNILAEVLKEKLEELEMRGYPPENGYIFGFSLGARLAIRAGTMFGHQRVGELDACDMAGPGFDKFDRFDPTLAAKNVQCIHTSKDKGTMSRNCHQNWNMGMCGMYQEGSGVLPGTVSSHGLCPKFYNAAFTHNFYAERFPEQCNEVSSVPQTWPDRYKMGYMEKRKKYVRGVLYASTISNFPYTPNTSRLLAWKIIQQFAGHIALIINDPNRIIILLKN